MAQINVRIDDEKKEEWQNAVEQNNEYDSLTHLVELAVHHELHDKWVLLSRINTFAEGIEFDTSEIAGSLEDMTGEMNKMRKQMNQLEALSEITQSEELREIALTANDHLPVIKDTIELTEPGEGVGSGHPDDIRPVVEEELGEKVSPTDLRLALDFLVYQYNNVNAHRTENGEWRYYEIDLS